MKILTVVDMQRDFIDGALGTKEAQKIVPNVVKKIEHAIEENVLVLMTKDTHSESYLSTLEGTMLPVKHCIEGTEGWSIDKRISEAFDNKYGRLMCSTGKIIKNRIYKNTFGSDDLRDLLLLHKDNIEEVEFCGLVTDCCVVSNALMCRQVLPNTRITVDASCCAGTTPEKHLAALDVMKSCQIEVINE